MHHRIRQFIDQINREVCPRQTKDDRHYNLNRPDGTRFGFVRFNIAGSNRNMYTVYADEPFDDPDGLFENRHADDYSKGWVSFVYPGDENGHVRVLESSYDQR